MSATRTPKKLWHLTAALVCLLIAVMGCAKSTPTPEPVTISFAHPNYDTEHYQQLLETFNDQYPHITVELQPKRWDMLGGLGAGDADCFLTSQFSLNWLVDQGNVLNLTPLIEQDETFEPEDYYPGTMGLYTREGKTYAVPAGVDIMVMFYNQDLLDLYGVPYPDIGWTWDDFLTTGLSVRDPAADTFGYLSTVDVLDVLTFIYQHGGRFIDDLQNPSRTTFDDPMTIDAVEWYANLYQAYNIAPTQEQMREVFRGTDPRKAILLGQIATWSAMLSERGGQGWDLEWDMRWGVTTLPRDQQAMTLTLVEGTFVSSQTRYPDACWTWISFLSKQLPARQTPARRSLAESDAYRDKVGANVAAVAQASMEKALLLSPELAEYEEALELFAQAFQAVMAGTSTADEALTWAQQQSKFK